MLIMEPELLYVYADIIPSFIKSVSSCYSHYLLSRAQKVFKQLLLEEMQKKQ